MARYIVFIFTLCMGGLGSYYYFFGLAPHKVQETFQTPTQEFVKMEVLESTPVLEVSVEENSTQEESIEAEKKKLMILFFYNQRSIIKKTSSVL